MSVTWLNDAACRGKDPNIWFPGTDRDLEVQARLVCASCPVQAECFVSAGDVDGIRGGLSLRERRRHEPPAVALEAAQRRAGWKPCLECGGLFKPSRRNHVICTKRCWNRRWHRLRYQNDPVVRAEKQAAMRRYREAAAAAERVKRQRRYWSNPEKARAERRARYRREKEKHMGLHATTVEKSGDLELVQIVNRYPSGEVTEAWEVNCLLCTENLINTDREAEARVVLDEPHVCPD